MPWPHDDSAPRRPESRPSGNTARPGQREGQSRREDSASDRPAYGRRPRTTDNGRPAYGNRDNSPRREHRPAYNRPAEPAYSRPVEPEFIPSLGDADTTPQTAVGGMREVEELLRNDPGRVHRVLFRLKSENPKLYTLQKLARKLHIHVQQVEGRVLEQYAVPNGGVVALCHEKEVRTWIDVRQDLFAACEKGEPKLVAVVTNIEDPRNLGACIRSCLALGVDTLLMPSKGMCGLTPTVARAAAGALEKLRICRPENLEGALGELILAGYKLVGLDADTQTHLPGYEFPSHVVMAVGGEDRGLPPFIRKQCTAVLRIPMMPDAHSYNASVALSLGLYEVARTRLESAPPLPLEI